jgi:hypothetical protein
VTLSSTNWGVPKVGNPWPRLMASCVFASAVKAAKRLGVLRLGWIASEGVNVEKATVTVLVRDRCVVAVRRMQVVMDFMGGDVMRGWFFSLENETVKNNDTHGTARVPK